MAIDADLREVNLLLFAHLCEIKQFKRRKVKEKDGSAHQANSNENLLGLLGEMNDDDDDVNEIDLHKNDKRGV